jgi:hypothetical protein
MSISKFELIFEEWKFKLKSKSRDKNHVLDNMMDLFDSFKSAGLSREEAYEYVVKAAKAHYPNVSVAKKVYKDYVRLTGGKKTERVFVQDWQESISDKASEAYYEVYQVEPPSYDEYAEQKDKSKKKYSGVVPEQEYRQLRKYADQFEILDTKELEEQMKDVGYIPLEDESFVENVLGEDDGSYK